MKYLVLGMLLLIASVAHSQSNFYELRAQSIDGNEFSFASLKGKKVIIVNTASRCGFTKQYADLEKLSRKYSASGLVIIGFPSNDFMNQEPGSDAEIKQFCTLKFGITFQMMAKIIVKGKNMSPVYQWLTQKSKNGVMDSEIKWNFQKYLIDENGRLVDVVYSATTPFDPKIVNWIEGK
jgi:glutathione peroxidase